MIQYKYIAQDSQGKQHKGSISANNANELLAGLKNNGLYCLKFWEVASTEPQLRNNYKMRLKDIVIFCRQLSAMLHAGVSIVHALQVLHDKALKPKYKACILKIYESVQKGNGLSQAMTEQHNTFPRLLISMVESGETGGTLDEVMVRMADHYEKENRLINKMKNAAIYPIALMVISLGVVIILLTVVMPVFLTMFDGLPLPPVTQLLINISDAFRNHGLLIAIAIFGLIMATKALLKIPKVRYRFDKLKLTFPVIGKLQRTIYTAQCARNLSTMYASGVSTLQALELTTKILNNTYITDHMNQVIEAVKKGTAIGSAMDSIAVFDPMFNAMVYIGEESGNLDSVLEKTALYFDDESETALKSMVALSEPVMIVLLGVIVGFIIIAMMLPIFTMYSIMG